MGFAAADCSAAADAAASEAVEDVPERAPSSLLFVMRSIFSYERRNELCADAAYLADDAEAVHRHRNCLFKEEGQQLAAAISQHRLIQDHGVGFHRRLKDARLDRTHSAHAARFQPCDLAGEGIRRHAVDLKAQPTQLRGLFRGGAEAHWGAGTGGGKGEAGDVAKRGVRAMRTCSGVSTGR